jgi:hypothetical protein
LFCLPDTTAYFVLTLAFSLVGASMLLEILVYGLSDIRASYLAYPALIFVQFGFSGIFLKRGSMPNWLEVWFPDLSLIGWFLEGCFMNQYAHATSILPTVRGYSTYEAFLELFGWVNQTKWFCFRAIVLNMVGYRIIVFIVSGLTAAAQKGGRSVRSSKKDMDP